MPTASPYCFQVDGWPRRSSSSSSAGRSSWTSENVCTSSSAAAAGSAVSASPPAASAVARQITGRTRLPPTSIEYRTDSACPPSSGGSASSPRYDSTSARRSSVPVKTPPPAWPAGAASPLPSRSPRAPRGCQSPRPGPSSPPASRACARAGRAAPPRCAAAPPRRRSCSLLDDPAENAVHKSSSIFRGVALGKGDGLVDRHLRRHVAAVELEDRHAQDVALEGAEAVGRPLVGGGGDARVELRVLRDDGLGELERERVDLALVQRGQLLAGDVPLVEEDQRRAARRPPAGHQAISAISTSTRSTSSPETAASARPTRSCTARASSASDSPCGATRSSDADARPSPCWISIDLRGRRRRTPSTLRAAPATRSVSAAAVSVIDPSGPSKTSGSVISAPPGDAARILGREHQARRRDRP